MTMAAGARGTSTRRVSALAWALWDWGGASFTGVLTAVLFGIYITSYPFGSEATVSAGMGAALLIAGVVVALFAPVIGKLSDSAGRRKAWLGINTALVIASMLFMMLMVPSPDFLPFGLVLLAVGTVAFEFAAVNYNSMLGQVSTERNVGRVSAFGWGMGYIGGIVLLVVILAGFILPEAAFFGVTFEEGWAFRAAMGVCALWFALFALPIFFAVPEISAEPRVSGSSRGIIAAYSDVLKTIARLWRTSRPLLYFLIASAVFRDGLAGIMNFGAIIGAQSFGFDATDVMLFAIAANLVAGIVTLVLGMFEDRIGAKRLMVVAIAFMVTCTLVLSALSVQDTWVFWAFGLTLAAFVGPVHAASRSFLTRMIPPGQEGEIFGLYTTTGRVAMFLSPAAFTIAIALGGTTRWGTFALGIVLLLGLLLLLAVRTPQGSKGKTDTMAAAPSHTET